MKKILRLFLILSVLVININAKEEYTKENIKKHLEVLFKKNIRYEKNNKYQRYLPFRNTINLYYEFSPLIQNQKEKIEILKEVIKKFEKVINLKIELKHGKPDISFSKQNGMLKTIYNSNESVFEEHIYFDFSIKKEVYKKLKKGFWYKKFFLGKKNKRYQRVLDYLKKEREISIGNRTILPLSFKNISKEILVKKGSSSKKIPITSAQLDFIRIKNFHLLELNQNRKEYFKEFIHKTIYLSILSTKSKLYTSTHIKPSIINRKNDNYIKGEVSQFDWILLDEFYNNKKLETFMFYKTQVIPILSTSIYQRLKRDSLINKQK